MTRIFLMATLVVCLTSCPEKNQSGDCVLGTCTNTQDCAGGQICNEGCCTKLCNTVQDCFPGQDCTNGICTGNPLPVDPPRIISVNGTGSTDTTAGHSNRHLRDRLVVSGERLVGATATLTGPNPIADVIDLQTCDVPTDTQVALALPTTIVPGTYTLTLTNAGGECSASLTLAQGEPGSLTASGAQIIASLNNTLTADPTLYLRGAFGGQVTALSVTADASQTRRSISVQGAEQIPDNTFEGLYLVVLSFSSHAVVDQVGTAQFRTKQNFNAGDDNHITGLIDTLNTLTEDHVVILASAGNVTNMLTHPGLQAKLQEFGASAAMASFQNGYAYTFIGEKGLAPGEGLEIVAGSERGGVAQIPTLMVEGTVVGFRNLLAATSNIKDSAITFAKIDPNARQQIFVGPVGCGNKLTTEATCQTLQCESKCGTCTGGYSCYCACCSYGCYSQCCSCCGTPSCTSSPDPKYFDCAGNCSNSASVSCATSPVGWMAK